MAEIVKKERVPYRIWDKVNSKWNELMLKTNAKSVDADDGKTLETKIGAVNGITSDLNGEASDVAASIKCVNQLNNSLGGLQFGIDENGNYGYIKAGADTVTPFKSGFQIIDLGEGTSFDIKTNYPKVDYTSLTVDNFITAASSIVTTNKKGTYVESGLSEAQYIYCDFPSSPSFIPSINYDSETGILTIGTTRISAKAYVNKANASYTTNTKVNHKVYLIY